MESYSVFAFKNNGNGHIYHSKGNELFPCHDTDGEMFDFVF